MAKHAIVIGGSISGLMCGVMLKHHSYDVTILEKEALAIRQGYDAGIKIGPAVVEFLEKHDRLKRDMSIICRPGVMIDIEGKPKARRGQTMITTSWGLMISVLRANFDGLTSAAVPVAPNYQQTSDGKAIFRGGARAIGLKNADGKVEVQFINVESEVSETLQADIVIVADGSNSNMRNMLLPEVKREYLGYMCWRGTAREEDVPTKWNELYAEKATVHLMNRSYLLNYTIPTDDGVLAKGKRLHNWVWYSNFPADSPRLEQLFTDINGKLHRGTVPRHRVCPKLWEEQNTLAKQVLPEGLAAIVEHSTPFLTKVFETTSAKASFLDGKVFLVGDAQITLRPNIGMSSTHAAFDCNELEKVIEGIATPAQWERTVLRWGAAQQGFGKVISAYGLQSKFSAVWNALSWLVLLFGQKIGVL